MDNTIQRLIKLLSLKEEKVHEVMEITLLQKEALSKSNIDELVNKTDLKQEIIEQINIIDEEFESCYKGFIVNNEINNNDISNLKEKISKILNIIQNINDIEQNNKLELNIQMNGIKNNIKSINLGKKGMNAYFQKGLQVSNYIDQKK